MPYLSPSNKERIDTNPGLASTGGDWNYLYTLAMIKAWKSNQSYATIHNLKMAARNPSVVEPVMEVESLLVSRGVSNEDRFAARELAFFEFYRRVAAIYEERKIVENGDVYDNVPFTIQHITTAPPTLIQQAEQIAMEVPLTTFADDMEIGAGTADLEQEVKPNVNDNRTQRKGKGR